MGRGVDACDVVRVFVRGKKTLVCPTINNTLTTGGLCSTPLVACWLANPDDVATDEDPFDETDGGETASDEREGRPVAPGRPKLTCPFSAPSLFGGQQ